MTTDTNLPLADFWYVALAADRLRRGAIRAVTLLSQPILLGRDTGGVPFALRDLCPHRGVPLSEGRFDGREVECCYHGWRFDTEGACTAIPSLVAGQSFALSRIRVRQFPVREAYGFIWIFLGDGPADAAPAIPGLPGFADTARPQLTDSVTLESGIDNAVVGLLDPAHGPYVHRSRAWRSAASIHDKAKAFAPSELGFTMVRHAPSKNSFAYRILGGKPETEIAFRLPGLRIEHVRAGSHQLVNFTAVTPLTTMLTEIHNALFWTMPWLGALRPLLRPFAHRFLRQDRDIMVKQARGLVHNPPLLLVDDADRLAKWYFRLKNEWLRARSEGRPFDNPVRARVLRWRS